jgi:hypothetical protein
VFTCVSGSGKSSLVFDTIVAESQRLYRGANPGRGGEPLWSTSSAHRPYGEAGVVLASGSVAQAARDAALVFEPLDEVALRECWSPTLLDRVTRGEAPAAR